MGKVRLQTLGGVRTVHATIEDVKLVKVTHTNYTNNITRPARSGGRRSWHGSRNPFLGKHQYFSLIYIGIL